MLRSEGLCCSKTKPHKKFETLFEQLTKKMFFDQKRKKNFIAFYELVEHLVVEFIDTEVSSCDMSVSKTDCANEEQSLSELITGDISKEAEGRLAGQ
jgi:hypothetical protein